MRHSFSTAAAVLATTLLLAGCGETKTAETAAASDAAAPGMSVADSAAMPTDSARMGKAGGVMVDGVAMTADKSIVENAAAASSVRSMASRPTKSIRPADNVALAAVDSATSAM